MEDEYYIPEEIDSKIPDYFYFALAGELVSVFGPQIFEMYDEDFDGWYDLHSSTAGWGAAFYMTCRKLDMHWLLDYYEALEWTDSDIFDEIIEDRVVHKFIEHDFKVDYANCYYRYLLAKDYMEGQQQIESEVSS